MWHNLNVYPSLKSLSNWIRDLELRIDFIKVPTNLFYCIGFYVKVIKKINKKKLFIQIWLIDKKPTSFWISGLSFPQGFITGMLQTHARKYNISIDQLKLDFAVLDVVLDQETVESEHKIIGKEVRFIIKIL